MTIYLVDNSVWQKAARSPAIAKRMRELPPQHLVMTCPPQVLEYCYSARNAAEFRELRDDMARFIPADHHPDEHDVLDLQQALWEKGLRRAAAAFDCLIAAYAMANDAIVLHSDRDFACIAEAVGPAFRQEYVPE